MTRRLSKGHTLEVAEGRGKHKVTMLVIESGDQLTAVVRGGERPHVGAVAVAVPRPSLRDPFKTSSTSSVITLLGHKDDEIARPVSERMSKALNRVVVVVAGVHVDRASRRDIEVLKSNSFKCAAKAVPRLRRISGKH